MSNVVRAAEQLGHRVGEGVEKGFNDVKRATVGGNKPADKAQEGTHQAENRLKETGNEILDGIKTGTSTNPSTNTYNTNTRNL